MDRKDWIALAQADRADAAPSTREAARLAALRDYRLLDAPADDELTAVVRAAALVAGVPHATLNLVDEDRQCQLTTVGFEGADSARADSMCALHFEEGLLVHVPDASRDPRFARNPWVDGRLGHVRTYASSPLVSADGHAWARSASSTPSPAPSPPSASRSCRTSRASSSPSSNGAAGP